MNVVITKKRVLGAGFRSYDTLISGYILNSQWNENLNKHNYPISDD